MSDDLMERAIAEAYASSPLDDGIILYTLEFLHPTFDVPARICSWPVTGNEPERFLLKLENTAPVNKNEYVEFIGVPFEITLPSQEDNAPGEIKLSIQNIGHILSVHLLAAVKQREPIRIISREYLKSIPEYPQLIFTDYSINRVSVNNNNVEATATMIDWLLRPWGRKYLPSDFPGLMRGR